MNFYKVIYTDNNEEKMTIIKGESAQEVTDSFPTEYQIESIIDINDDPTIEFVAEV